MSYFKLFCKYKNSGFTLIELIVVIVLIAIMAVTVLPKFLTSSGFEEYTYRDELITKLRAVQLRTMQQTNNGKCQLIKVEPSNIGLLATTPNAITCETSYLGDTSSVMITDNNINFVVSENLSDFSFSSLGKPLGCAVLNPCEITITVNGESDPQVFINSQGYIYAL